MSQDLESTFEEEGGSSRRSLLTKGAVAAAVATVAGLAISRDNALAGAGNGVNMTQGAANTGATITTSLAGGSTLRVIDGTSVGIGAKRASLYGSNSVTGNIGVLGETTGSFDAVAVYGRNDSSGGIGVYGVNLGLSGTGVYGEHNSTSTGAGVIGKSSTGPGVQGFGSTSDFQASGSGRVLLSATGVATPPSGASAAGTLARDAAGNLWYSPASGQYRKLGGTATAGAFHAISPVRVYDSRSALPTPGKINPGESRVVSVKDGRNQDTGGVTAADVVPAGASAVAFNITVTGTEASGYLSAVPGDAATESGSVINWFGNNQDIANGLIGKVDASRQLKVFGGGGGKTHFVIDISGYFL